MALEILKTPAAQIRALPRDRTLFLFAVGPVEDHGDHLPMGLDLIKAEHSIRHLAEMLEKTYPGWTAVLMPPAPLGIDSDTTEYAITVRPHVLRDWLVDAASSLHRQGFIHFLCVSGHLGPRQLTAIEEAGKLVGGRFRWLRPGSRPRLLSGSSALVGAAEVLRAPVFPDPTEHGGQEDTSLGLYLAQDLVDPGYTALPARQRMPSLLGRLAHRWSRRLRGYWGDPAKASATDGAMLLAAENQKVLERLFHVLNGGRPRSLFRTWYSIIPTNWSFFKAWLIAFVFFVVMIAWLWLSLQWLPGE